MRIQAKWHTSPCIQTIQSQSVAIVLPIDYEGALVIQEEGRHLHAPSRCGEMT